MTTAAVPGRGHVTSGGLTGADGDRSAPSGRVLGVDAARAVALLGMMVTHLVPQYGATGGANAAFTVADGRASALFAVVAGMSLALADGGPRNRAATDGHQQARRPFGIMVVRVGVRAVLVGALGMLLALSDPPILVILTYYALLFVLVAPLLRLPAVVLAVLGVGWAVAGPVLSHLIRRTYQLDVRLDQPSFGAIVTDPAGLARELLLTGTYPAGTWLAYALVGAALGRAVLTPKRLVALAGTGLALAAAAHLASSALLRTGAAVLGTDITGYTLDGRFFGTTPTSTWWWLAIARPHSGTPFDLLATIGSAVVVIAVLVLVLSGSARWVLGWLTLTGSMTLTLYCGHVLAAALGLPVGVPPGVAWLVHAGLAVALALVWRGWYRRGPLEAVVAAAVAAATPRSSQALAAVPPDRPEDPPARGPAEA